MVRSIYQFLKGYRVLWIALVLLTWGVFAFQAFKISIQEDVSKTLPQGGSFQKYQEFFSRSPLASQVVLAIGQSGNKYTNSELIQKASEFVSIVDDNQSALIDSIQLSFAAEGSLAELGFFRENLPVFLNSEQQKRLIDSIKVQEVDANVTHVIDKLMSPEGYALKNFLLNDPLGLQGQVLLKLSQLQEGGDFKVIDQHLFTEDFESCNSTYCSFISSF